MLAPPADLSPDTLTATLRDDWGLAPVAVGYRAVGWGSHHWEVTGAGGRRWFVTVDDLLDKRRHAGEPLAAAYGRLSRALSAAQALELPFVVAPVAGPVRLTDRYAAALYPYVEGESFRWGDYPDESHRRAVQDMLVAVHGDARRTAGTDDFAVQHRDVLEAAPAGEPVADCGPYAARAADLISAHAAPVRALLERYDALVAGADPARAVLTHGEPHPGNTMRTATGWKLIDWETALLAPPERDLWLLGGDLGGYTAATGVTVQEPMLELYRRRWALTDLGVDVARFRRPHSGGADDQESWVLLDRLVRRGLS